MFDLDRFREVLDTLRRNAVRTLLTAVGVFWGVFMLIVMVGMGNGLESGTKKGMRGLATNSLYIWGQRTSVPYAGLQPGRRVKLTIEDAEAMAGVPGVAVVAPRVALGGRRATQGVKRGDKEAMATVMGDTPQYRIVKPMEIEGRFINPFDMDQRRKVAVIGTRVRELLFEKGEEPIGESITVAGVDFMVVGVFETAQTGDAGARDAATVYVPLTTFQKALTNKRWLNYISVLSEPGTRASVVQETLTGMLRKRHKASPSDKQAIGSFNADAEYQKIVNLFDAIAWLILIVASATLMAGLVGVSNIMMVSVRERTREIGIRKAIGATPAAVVGQIVMEAVALASVAGYVALVAGVALLELVGYAISSGGEKAATMIAPPTVNLTTALIAAAAVAFGGALAGLFPALHAARIHTVTALRAD
jgi:putative ABC transport system permease protein